MRQAAALRLATVLVSTTMCRRSSASEATRPSPVNSVGFFIPSGGGFRHFGQRNARSATESSAKVSTILEVHAPLKLPSSRTDPRRSRCSRRFTCARDCPARTAHGQHHRRRRLATWLRELAGAARMETRTSSSQLRKLGHDDRQGKGKEKQDERQAAPSMARALLHNPYITSTSPQDHRRAAHGRRDVGAVTFPRGQGQARCTKPGCATLHQGPLATRSGH